MFARRVLVVMAAVLAAAGLAGRAAPAADAPASAPQSQRVATLESSVLDAVNAVRREHGLASLRLSPQLTRAAAQHSQQMGELGFFEHDSADGSAFWKRVVRWYPSTGWRSWAVGENLLWASPDVDAEQAVELWLESPEHRANLLAARWREIGLGAVHVQAATGAFHGLDVTILTADFGVRR